MKRLFAGLLAVVLLVAYAAGPVAADGRTPVQLVKEA